MSIELDRDKSTHLTIQLADSLRRLVQSGSYPAGHLIPSERELSEQHHLSRTTVRRAIQLLVDDGMLYRVPGSGTYVGKPPTQYTSPATLGLLAPTFANPFFGELSDAIEQEVHKQGYQLLVGRSEFAPANENAYLARYAENPTVKGVLLVPTSGEIAHDIRLRLAQHNTPFVYVARGAESVETDVVATDHVRGAQEAVRHLIALGHQRIAYIRSLRPEDDTHIKGYMLALREAGIVDDPDLVISVDADAEQAGIEGVRRLLERGTRFTAIFARIDMTAVGVMRALRETGLRVPDDVSVVGFDNTQLAAHLTPPLTTVDHTLREIGRLAVLLLLDRVEGRYDGPARRITIQPSLVLRDSCATLTESSVQ